MGRRSAAQLRSQVASNGSSLGLPSSVPRLATNGSLAAESDAVGTTSIARQRRFGYSCESTVSKPRTGVDSGATTSALSTAWLPRVTTMISAASAVPRRASSWLRLTRLANPVRSAAKAVGQLAHAQNPFRRARVPEMHDSVGQVAAECQAVEQRPPVGLTLWTAAVCVVVQLHEARRRSCHDDGFPHGA